MPALALRASTMACISGASCGPTGTARYMRRTILSLQNNALKFITPARTRAIVIPERPPSAAPTARRSPVIAASSSVVFTMLMSPTYGRRRFPAREPRSARRARPAADFAGRRRRGQDAAARRALDVRGRHLRGVAAMREVDVERVLRAQRDAPAVGAHRAAELGQQARDRSSSRAFHQRDAGRDPLRPAVPTAHAHRLMVIRARAKPDICPPDTDD